MLNFNVSSKFKNIIKDYEYVKDEEGMSPAQVYKLVGKINNLYLKMSNSILNGTTYDVSKEKEVMIWIGNKLTVPEVLYYESFEGNNYLLMSELKGITLAEYHKNFNNNEAFVTFLAESVINFQKISIKNCPFNVTTDIRLAELDYLIKNNLADVDCCSWEEDTEFKDPKELYNWLCNNKPKEELVFSHGDLGDSNILVNNNKISGFIDLGRAGIADKWYDIAFCVREIKHNIGDEKYIHKFFHLINETPNWEKIRYYTLLDELF